MKPTKEQIQQHFRLHHGINRLLDYYIFEKAIAPAYKVSFEFEYDGTIKCRWEVNTACHCHPEMEQRMEVIKFDDFWEWLKDQDLYEHR